MKRVTFALLITLPLLSYAQKRNEYTFDFTKPETLNPPVLIDQDEDFNGKEVSFQNTVLKSDDGLVSVSFKGREEGSMGGALQTGWPKEDGTFDHYLFIIRGGGMVVSTANGITLDSLIFSTDSYVGNLKLLSPEGVGRVEARNESWYGLGAEGITELVYQNYGQNPKIGAFTVIYRSPMDVLEPVRVTPAPQTEVHRIETIELSYAQAVKIGTVAKFELTGPRGFNPVLLSAQVVGNKVLLTLPDGVTIDESNEARRGTYTLTMAENSVIGDDADGYYNKKTVYTFNVVEAYNKFEVASIWPDGQVEQVTEIPNGIVVGFASEIGKFSADELKLFNRDGSTIRTLKAQWLEESEYTEDAPYYKHDRDIYSFVKFAFSGDKTAAVKATGIYHFTIPEGFIWNNEYDATVEDEGISEGARFNPELTIEYNVNGVVYPSDEVLQAAKDLLAVTGAGYPAAESPARLALQKLVDEGIGADAVFEEAMAAFYAETDIEMPSAGYYLLSAVDPNGKEVYLCYEENSIGLTYDVEDAVHLLATLNEDATIVFETPDHKYLKQMMPAMSNVTAAKGKSNNLTFTRLVLKDEEGQDLFSPKQLFGLWSINGIVATNDEGADITAYTLVNLGSLAFETSRDKSLRYFSATQTNAFRLTETDAPIPSVNYAFNPASGSSLETLYRIEIAFTNVDEVIISNDAKSLISLNGSNAVKYSPNQIVAVEGSKNKFQFSFEDVRAGSYSLVIPKGTFTWTYDERTVAIPEISASYTVKSGIDFKYDFQTAHTIYYHSSPNLHSYNRDVDLGNFILSMQGNVKLGISNKPVKIMDVYEQFTFKQGRLIPYSDPDYPDYTMLKFVLDEPITEGSLEPGKYCFVVDAGTFGDENYAKWLQDPQSISKSECHVNHVINPIININNDRVNIQLSPDNLTDITRLSQVTITLPYHENVEIPENKTIVARNYDYDNPHTITTQIDRVEGTTNQFRFTSDEVLRFSENADARRYSLVIPKGFFTCGTVSIPSYDDTMFFYYASGVPDAIDTITTDQQSEAIYDLAGRRVKDTRKAGIYIVGGRKVVVQ